MKKNLTEIVFILDRSGSMGGLEADTIGGYNSMLKKQQEEEGEAVFSTVLFDDKVEVLHNRLNVNDVKPITDKEYYVRGCTALLDAVGGAIKHIGDVQKAMPKEERPDKTLFIITTDGMENASRKYSYDKVKKMVEKKKEKHGWEFIFMGANMDAIEVAGHIGVDANRAVRFACDAVGTKLNYDAMAMMVGCARRSSSKEEMKMALNDDALLANVRAHYESSRK